MNRTRSTLAALSLCAAPAVASAEPAGDKTNPTREGAGALLFTVGGITGSPSAIDGVGLGGLYFVSKSLAIRAALGLTKLSDTKEPPSPSPKEEKSNLALALEGGVEFIVVDTKATNIWVGGLAQVAHGSSEEKDVKEASETAITVAGALGADWFFSDYMSLGAEYRLGLQNKSSEEKPEGGKATKQSVTTIGVGSAGLRVGFWW